MMYKQQTSGMVLVVLALTGTQALFDGSTHAKSAEQVEELPEELTLSEVDVDSLAMTFRTAVNNFPVRLSSALDVPDKYTPVVDGLERFVKGTICDLMMKELQGILDKIKEAIASGQSVANSLIARAKELLAKIKEHGGNIASMAASFFSMLTGGRAHEAGGATISANFTGLADTPASGILAVVTEINSAQMAVYTSLKRFSIYQLFTSMMAKLIRRVLHPDHILKIVLWILDSDADNNQAYAPVTQKIADAFWTTLKLFVKNLPAFKLWLQELIGEGLYEVQDDINNLKKITKEEACNVKETLHNSLLVMLEKLRPHRVVIGQFWTILERVTEALGKELGKIRPDMI